MANVTAGAWAGSKPAANMEWYEAAAFVNWLNTSTGHHEAYDLTFSGGFLWSMTVWSSAQAWQTGGQNLYRHKDSYYFLPSEDEWYKAAYHKNDGVTAAYWDYPTGSNSIPTAITSGTGAGTALYDNTPISPANVDQSGGLSPYGSRGQGGNVFEWAESAFDGVNNLSNESRVVRGGAWYFGEDGMRSSLRLSYGPAATGNDFGFRVASVVPEPTAAVSFLLGLGLLASRRNRQARARKDSALI
jgi:formylglycine-generating enzyme required for sulfatase activity